MTEPAEGGCLCGKVRYRVLGEPVATTLCHCRSCRRASGGTNVAWAVFEARDFKWLAAEPIAYSSSRGIEWLHCNDCGSLVGYRRSSRPDNVDSTTGTLDEPVRGRDLALAQDLLGDARPEIAQAPAEQPQRARMSVSACERTPPAGRGP